MRIGILTFHKSYNYGAFMQCYSLVKKIESDFPNVDVEVIDYTTQSIIKNYDLSIYGYLIGDNFTKEFGPVVKMKKFISRFLELISGHSSISKMKVRNNHFKKAWSFLPLSKHEIVSDDYHKLSDKIKDEYDAVIVGSDAVWNWNVRGFPNAYFLNNVIGAKKLSYAASSYGQDYTAVTENQRTYLKEAWSKYSYIGVRDSPTENFLKSVNNNLQVSRNCDPTVLLDMDKIPVEMETIEKKLIKAGINPDRPIIGIMGSDWITKEVKSLFGSDYQIVSVYKPNRYADAFLYDLTPFEWAKVFSLFTITFTHFFHGTLLSLKNLTPTIPIEPTSNYSSKFDTKIIDLLKRTDLLDCHFTKDYLDENGWEHLKTKALDIINSPIKDKIKAAMDKEALSYVSFQKALMEIQINKYS